MGVLITVSLGGGRLVLRNRELEHLEVVSKLGQPHQCLLRFDLDTNSSLALYDFHGPLSVQIADDSILGGAKAVLFDGLMTGGTQDHQLRGGSSFEILGASPLLFGMEQRESATFRPATWAEAAAALQLQVIDPPRFSVQPNGYRMFGETRLDFVRRMADDAGFFVLERDGQIQLRSQFDDAARRELTWGRELLALRARSRLVNHRYRGGVYEEQAKADYRFRDQHREPAVTGALKLCDAVKQVATTFANPQDPNLLMSDSRAAARTVFRDVLQRESERALGTAVSLEGEARDFLMKVGETIQLIEAPGFPLPGSTGVYGLVELTHRWDASEYRNHFVASPWKNFTSFTRPPLKPAAGPFLAEVLETPEEFAQRGFVFVRMAHMQPDEGDSFIGARLVTPFAGNQRGLVFMPEVGDEVLVDFAQGDPEHPYVIGSLWNGKDGCPGQEPKQIVTKNGNVLALHDDGWIELYTPEGKCMLQMSNQDGQPRVTLHSEGDLVLEAKGQLQIRAGSVNEVIGGGVKRKVDGDETVEVAGTLTHACKGVMTHNGKGGSLLDGAGSKVTLAAAGARMKGTMSIIEGQGMAVVSGGVVQLNPPVVPPEVPLPAIPPQVPDELATTWKSRDVPAATVRFDSDGDPEPGS